MFKDFITILSNKVYVGYILEGLWHTVALTVLAALIGLVIGCVVAIVKIAATENKYMKIPAIICDVYTTIIRGTPVALQLFVMVFAILAFPGFKPAAAIITFGINSGAYVSENIRAGILSVDKGQMEAGRALGMTWLQTMVKIVIPQAFKNVVPAIGNELIALLKETSILGLIGTTVGTLTFDLTAAADEISHQIFSYLAPSILVGLCYLAIVYMLVLLVKFLERRLRQSDKR